MAEGLGRTKHRREDNPFELCYDLRCLTLRSSLPISRAAYEAKEREKQRAQGIIPLSECRRVE